MRIVNRKHYKLFYIIFFSLFLYNCQLNKPSKTHGINFLDNRGKILLVGTTNKNDIIKTLGPPSTKSTFNNDLWIYIERITSKKALIKLGQSKIITNNVLVLEINKYGLLVKKDFIDITKMNEIDFSQEITSKNYSKKSFLYNFLSSMRQKINDPLGKRKKP